MSNLSTYYSFNQPDVNLNGQVVNWATESPVYDASLNGSAYISSQNYKTGNGSLQFPKNTIGTQGNTVNTMTITVTPNAALIGMAVSNDNLTMFICEYNGKTFYYKRTDTTSSFSTSTKTVTNIDEVARAYYRIATNSNASRFVACDTSYVYFSNWYSTTYNTLTAIDSTLRTSCRGVSITPDGNKVVGCGAFGVIFTTWNTTTNTYNPFTNTPETIDSIGISISSNGNTIAYGGKTTRYWYISYWNGTNFNQGTAINSTALESTFEPRSTCFNNDASILFLSYLNNDTTNNTFYPIQYVLYNKNINSYDTFSNINTTSIRKITNGHGLCCVDSSDKCTIYAAGYNTTTIYYCDLSYNTTSTNYFKIKSININTNGFTIACWFRSNYNASFTKFIDFATGTDITTSTGAIYNNIRLQVINNYLRFTIIKSSILTPNLIDLSRNYINDNKWYHIAITIDNTTTILTVYIDSSKIIDNFNNISYDIVERSYCYLGKSHTIGEPQFFGNIDDFRVYNSVLTQEEITSLYNNTNVKNNYINSTVCRLYDTAVNNSSTPPITPIPSSNVGTNQTYYYWNDPYAKTLGINNSANPYNFYYTYNNITPYQNAKVSVVTSDLVTLKLNGVIQTNLLNSGNTFANPVTVPLVVNGNNLFEFLTYNNGGSAYFAAYVTDDSPTPNYLFSTKSDMGGWNVNITGFFPKGYPLSSLLQNNYTSSTAITTTNYRTNNYDLSRNYTKGNVVASTNTNISNVAISNTYNDINNALFSYIAGAAPTTISEPFTSNLLLYYKFNTGDILNGQFYNYVTSVYDTTNFNSPSIDTSTDNYKMGDGSFYANNSSYFVPPNITLSNSEFTISVWFKLNAVLTSGGSNPFIVNYLSGNRICISSVYQSPNMYLTLQTPSTSETTITDISMVANKWYYLGWSCSSTAWNVRLDEKIPTSVGSKSVTSFSQRIFSSCIGAETSGGVNKFNGWIDDFRMFNYALTATELTTLNNYRN